MNTPGWNGTVPVDRDFLVSGERLAEARRARLTVVCVAIALLVLAGLALVLFSPGAGTRFSLSAGSIVLAVLAVLLLVRIALIARKASSGVGADGSVLRLSPEGVTVSGDAFVPWHALSGAWALDSAPALRARAEKTVFGLPGRIMLRAGTNTASITLGILDVALVRDPATRATRFATLPSGATPARIELAFGSYFGTAELHEAFAAMRAALPPEVPVRLCSGALDYAAAWAGTADDVETIRQREASQTQ